MQPQEAPTWVRQMFDAVAEMATPRERATALRLIDHAYQVERRRVMAAIAYDLRRSGVDADHVAGLLAIERHFATRLIREHVQRSGLPIPSQVRRRGPVEAIKIED